MVRRGGSGRAGEAGVVGEPATGGGARLDARWRRGRGPPDRGGAAGGRDGRYSICLALSFWIRVLRVKEGSGGVKKKRGGGRRMGGNFGEQNSGCPVWKSPKLQPRCQSFGALVSKFSSFLSARIPNWFGQVRLSFSNKQSVSTILHSTPSSRAARPAQQIAL
jgi:hypothetical protein